MNDEPSVGRLLWWLILRLTAAMCYVAAVVTVVSSEDYSKATFWVALGLSLWLAATERNADAS